MDLPLEVRPVAAWPARRRAGRSSIAAELGELSTEYVSDELRKRHGDTVWRLRLGERWVYLLILLEQSRSFEDVLRVREIACPLP